MRPKQIILTYSETSKILNGLILLYQRIVALNQDVLLDDTSRLITATNDELEKIDQLMARLENFRSEFKSDVEEPREEPD